MAEQRDLEVLRGERDALEMWLRRAPGVFDGEDAAELERLNREIAEREEALPSWMKRP